MDCRAVRRKLVSIMKIEFVSFTGEYPVLCFGALTLMIDGKAVTFGYSDNRRGIVYDYRPFWGSGRSGLSKRQRRRRVLRHRGQLDGKQEIFTRVSAPVCGGACRDHEQKCSARTLRRLLVKIVLREELL